VLNSYIRRHGPLWLSLVAGIALWEIAGRSTSRAFMVPFSETLVRLWQLMTRGEFIAQFLDSAQLFLTGFALALIVGEDERRANQVTVRNLGTGEEQVLDVEAFIHNLQEKEWYV